MPENANATPKDERPLTERQLRGLIGWLAATLLGIGTLHAMFVMPMILREAGAEMRSIVVEHEDRPHAGAVTRDELLGWMQQLTARLERIERMLDNMYVKSPK